MMRNVCVLMTPGRFARGAPGLRAGRATRTTMSGPEDDLGAAQGAAHGADRDSGAGPTCRLDSHRTASPRVRGSHR